ncbi:hypothetical protein LTR62_007581 [Meristemomyces frigidus]|uniref:FAD-binding FR-type domain-containing protein n=1 Tax=Meristemomyces frigidus TaxID=1508187 RepID=A0AAN7YNW2_9PEZI|nr:hypothetical protein LTR62_007581 [Meristemomyces frigidus]
MRADSANSLSFNLMSQGWPERPVAHPAPSINDFTSARLLSTIPNYHLVMAEEPGNPQPLSGIDPRIHPQTNDDADFRRRLIEGILYSRWMIKTYHAVLLSVLLAFTAWHWWIKLQRRRRDVKPHKHYGTAASSSTSSTLSGNTTPPDAAKAKEVNDELTILLSKPPAVRNLSTARKLLRKLHALAIYQPPKIPMINKSLPSNSTTLLILLFLSLNLIYLLHRTSLTLKFAFLVADRASLLFVANLPWLYLLAAKNQPLKFLTGYSYENLNILHRRLGEWLCLLAVLHSAGMVVGWYTFLRTQGLGLWYFLTRDIILLGIGAFVCYELLFLTSLSAFRRWWYEIFLGTHVVLQAGALGFVFFHFHTARVYVGISLGIFLVDRVVYRLVLKSKTIRADLTLMDDADTVLVSGSWPLSHRFLSTLGQNVGSGWKPTEHVFLTVPALSRKHMIQAHPFTIAAAAPTDTEHAWFNLIIRAHDGFTRDLVRHAQRYASTEVRLDGPYGSLHALEMLRRSDLAVVVVGGSGIAVAYPLVWALFHQPDVETATTPAVGLIWVVHEAIQVNWIGQERLDELRNKGLQVCIPPPTSEAGRPDVSTLVENMVVELGGNSGLSEQSVGVVASGPDGMNRAVENTCAGMAWRGLDCSVAVEKYGW